MSSSLTGRSTPDSDDMGLLAALARALRAANFTAEGVEGKLGAHGLSARPVDSIVLRRRIRGEDAFSALSRLFLLGDEVDSSELDRALAPLSADDLVSLGICRADGTTLSATAMVVPHGEYYVACDLNSPIGSKTPFDYVPGVQAPSVTLAKLAVRASARSALDIGTGSGLQAMLAAKHCRSVVGTDVNQRALAFARFNARLNGLENIELRQGSSLSPVANERFDLIVSNPPYVISPEHSYAYRDSDVPGDELCRQIVQEIPERLNEGGFAHVLVSWTRSAAQDWDEPLRGWVSGLGCDAWLLHYRTSSPLDHAQGWLRPIGESDPVAFEAAVDRWLEYLSDRGIESVSYGVIVLRRTAHRTNWIRAEQLPLDRLEPAGNHTLRVFSGNDLLSELGDEKELLDARLRLTERHRLRQSLALRDGRFQVQEATLELTDGLRFGIGIDRYTMLLLPHLDGERSLSQALSETAREIELTDAAREQFMPAAMPVIRRLLELGFLEQPVHPG